MDKRKKLISLASGVAGLVLVASVIVLAQVTPGASSSKPMPTVTVTVTPDVYVDKRPHTEGDPSKPDIAPLRYETPSEPWISDPDSSLPADSLDPVTDNKFPAAKNKFELKFFKIADTSCKALLAKGAKYSYSDGSYALIAADSDGHLTGNKFDSAGNFLENFSYLMNWSPRICAPNSVNQQFPYRPKPEPATFLVESWDEVRYIWHSHEGSFYLSDEPFTVYDGMIRNVSDTESFESYDIRYGLNKLEKKSALKQY